MEELGGQPVSGIGFGLGVDRTFLACRAEGLVVADPARWTRSWCRSGSEARHEAALMSARLRRAASAPTWRTAAAGWAR